MAAAARTTTLTVARIRQWLALLPVRFDDRRFWGRALLGFVLRALALAAPFVTLRTAMTRAVVESLRWVGGSAIQLSNTIVLADAHAVNISASCTHIEVFGLLAPLLWSRRASLLRNIAQLGAMWIGMTLLALLRIDAAILLYAEGVPWEVGHDVALGISYALMIGWVLSRNAWTDQARGLSQPPPSQLA